MPLTRRAVLGSAAALSAAGVAWADPEPIPLGALFPFTGSWALFGDESFRGLELAADERNGAGGLLGRPVRLVKGDAVDAAAATSEAKRLIGAERAVAVFGTFASQLVLAASQVTELAGIPYFELGATRDAVTERGFLNLYRSCALASQAATLAADVVADVLAPAWGTDRDELRIAILFEDGLYGTTVSAYQATACKVRGLLVVDKLAYPAATGDLGSAVQRLRAANPTILLHTGYQGDTVLLYRQMRQAGWFPRMVIGAGGGYGLTDTANSIGPDFDGTLEVGFPSYGTNPAAAPGIREAASAYEKKYGAKPRSADSLASLVGARLFMDAIARAGVLDKDRIREAVRATALDPGLSANGWGASFDDKGQNTLATAALSQWQAGTLHTILPAPAATRALQPHLGT